MVKSVHGNKIFMTSQQYRSGKYIIDDTPRQDFILKVIQNK